MTTTSVAAVCSCDSTACTTTWYVSQTSRSSSIVVRRTTAPSPVVSTENAPRPSPPLTRYSRGRWSGPSGHTSHRTANTLAHFTRWISLSLRPKTETKRLNVGLSPELRLTNHCSAHHCSLHNVIAHISVFLCLLMNWRKSEVIFVHQNFISNNTVRNMLKMSTVSPDTSRETATPLTDGCNNNWIIQLSPFD